MPELERVVAEQSEPVCPDLAGVAVVFTHGRRNP